MRKVRIEKDSMGEVEVPEKALYGAQTQRALENFPISGIRFNRRFIETLGLIKRIAARVNNSLELIPKEITEPIEAAALEVQKGKHDAQFPLDIFQTGSGTSTNMNANEVIANRARQLAIISIPEDIHPNDHVNYGQSSNDVIPTAIRIAAYYSCQKDLVPALKELRNALIEKGKQYHNVVRTGRTHLMDAMPVTYEQTFKSYHRQIDLNIHQIYDTLERLRELPIGGTAVGTGINTHPEFGLRFVEEVSGISKYPFTVSKNRFEGQSTVNIPVELSGVMKNIAVGMMKIVNDLRWMNSGPYAGIGEIKLAAVQPGSSIMPGKVNPVIEESVAMVCAQVIGYDSAIGICGISGNFELNTMLPLVGHNLLEQIRLLSNACSNLANRSVKHITVNEERIKNIIEKNPILVTALNPIIGYEKAAKIAKRAFAEDRPIKEVALEETDLEREKLDVILDPIRLTRGGLI